MTVPPAQKRKYYHAMRIRTLSAERDKIQNILATHRLSALHGAEHIALEKRLARIKFMLNSSAKAYTLGGYADRMQITPEMLAEAQQPPTTDPTEEELLKKLLEDPTIPVEIKKGMIKRDDN